MQMKKYIVLFRKIVNRETIIYGIAGILTTIVNLISFWIFNQLGIYELISNVIAWVIAVTFAYLVNKNSVFQSKSATWTEEGIKIAKFYTARLLSLGIEQIGIIIFFEFMGFNVYIVKGALAIIVIIMNYIFSKLFIFNKK